MRLLPRQHHLQYTGDPTDGLRHLLEVGDEVYLNDGGRLFAVTLLECGGSKCVGIVNQSFSPDCRAGSVIEFGEEAIYVVKKHH